MKNKIYIATILPYKENYTFSEASAASLWVYEFFKKSTFKKNNFIFGSTKNIDYLSANYININLDTIRSKLSSKTNFYCEKISKIIKRKKFDLIEIHNRPLILINLHKRLSHKFIFYFHNDPLSMKGSKTENERLKILNITEKIIFVSKWVQDRFFINIDPKLKKKTEVVYPSVEKKEFKNIRKKEIYFVGRLNQSKGYDLYNEAITKILNKFPKWKAYSIGDEKRRSIYIKHKNHFELGFLKHKNVIERIENAEIVVIPSQWEEPFGRTALEAASCGCATITSNKGGLPETSDHHIILDKLTSSNLFRKIQLLIKNPKFRKKKQLDNYKNVRHLIKTNTKLIDQIRSEIILDFKLNIVRTKYKIINIYNAGQKLNHRLFNISLGKKFTNGFIRNGHDVLEISDRDFIRQNLPLFKLRSNIFQKFLINTFNNYNPDIVFFGHTNNIDLETLDYFKNKNKNLIISQWNEDPIVDGLEYSKQNIHNILKYSVIADHTFLTTSPNILFKKSDTIKNKEKFHFFFVPVDKNIEEFNVYNLRPKNDIFYAMSHGVNRGTLKEGKIDERIYFLDNLVNRLSDIKFDFYGFKNQEPIWGNDFNNALINSKMALNLSRGNPAKYYTSNRLASVMGNGLMTFIDKKVKMQDIFSDNEMVFYKNIIDLSDKIKFYSQRDTIRKKIAKNGKKKYFKLFNEKKITNYFINIFKDKKIDLF